MACRRCGGKPPLPLIRPGLPTVYAWGPFPGYEPIAVGDSGPDVDSENNGIILKED